MKIFPAFGPDQRAELRRSRPAPAPIRFYLGLEAGLNEGKLTLGAASAPATLWK